MSRFWRVEVVRTVEERRIVYIKANDYDTAVDATKDHAAWSEIHTPYTDPRTSYTVMDADEIDKPARVDVSA